MGVQFILFLGIDMGIGILLARESPGRAVALALLCVMFGFALAVFGVRIANPLGFIGGDLLLLLTASFGPLIAALADGAGGARDRGVFTLIMVMLGGAWVASFMFPTGCSRPRCAGARAIDGPDAMTWRGLDGSGRRGDGHCSASASCSLMPPSPVQQRPD
jgi:ABC-2 type transport system permease protein